LKCVRADREEQPVRAFSESVRSAAELEGVNTLRDLATALLDAAVRSANRPTAARPLRVAVAACSFRDVSRLSTRLSSAVDPLLRAAIYKRKSAQRGAHKKRRKSKSPVVRRCSFRAVIASSTLSRVVRGGVRYMCQLQSRWVGIPPPFAARGGALSLFRVNDVAPTLRARPTRGQRGRAFHGLGLLFHLVPVVSST